MPCHFCDVVHNGKEKLYQDDWVTAFFDQDPISKGHVLVLPNEHFADLDELPGPVAQRVFKVAQTYVALLKEKFAPQGYSIMQNGGAFNDIGHFHLHVFPRFNAEAFGWTYAEEVPPEARDFARLTRQIKKTLQDKMRLPALMGKEPFPVLRSHRLILDQLQHADIPLIIAYAGSENLSRSTLNIPHPYQEKDAIFWIESAYEGFRNKTQYTFAIRLQSTGEFIGGIGLRVQERFDRAAMGYWVAEPFWNLGYVTEAVKAMLKFGFETLGLHKIYATHLLDNPASGKVMIKNGMIKEGLLKDHTKKDGCYRSLLQYRLTKDEYETFGK